VVRTMKAMAASGIGQYERAVDSLGDYYRTVELGLAAYFFGDGTRLSQMGGVPAEAGEIDAIVLGSDQGLVGQFNEVLADFTLEALAGLTGPKRVWVVGERIRAHLEDAGLPVAGLFPVPTSVAAITPLVEQLLVETERSHEKPEGARLYLFHNRPLQGSSHEPTRQRLLPLDDRWLGDILQLRWPTPKRPEVVSEGDATLLALVSEYLFVSLFQACAASLASEHASRLAAMQRAEKNIGELLEELGLTFNRLRQNAIDEELFEVISGFEALTASTRGHP